MNNDSSKLDEAYDIPKAIPEDRQSHGSSSFFLSKALQKSQDSIAGFVEKNKQHFGLVFKVLFYSLVTGHFIWATYYFIDQSGKPKQSIPLNLFMIIVLFSGEYINETMCHGYGFLLLMYIATTFGFTYTWLLKPYFFKPIGKYLWNPGKGVLHSVFSKRYFIITLTF